MYSDFFKLQCLPFEDRADRRFFHARPATEEALAAMEYDIRTGKGLSLVLGSAGVGKTMLIRKLLQRLDPVDNAVVLTWPMTGPSDLIRETAKAFGVTLPAYHHRSRCLARLRRLLTRALGRNVRSILIIDQAENLTADNLAQLSTLADLEGKSARLLRIAVVGQPHIRTLLSQPEFSSVSQRFFGERVLNPLSPAETEEYIRHRLRIAGGHNDKVFDSNAIPLIHEAANGVPRLINHLCNGAMIAAYGAGVSRITRELVAETIGRPEVREKSIAARDLGVATAEHVAAGLEATATGASTVRATSGMAVTAAPRPGALDAGHSETIDMPDGPLTNEYAPYSHDGLGGRSYSDESTGDWYTGHTPTASSLTAGEDILNRLESALARADRMQVTMEATLTQFSAIEKHLGTLTGAADRLVGRVSESVRRGSSSLEQLEHRIEARFRKGEDRLAAAEARVEQATAEAKSTQHYTREIDGARESAERLETRLRTFVEKVADKVDQVQGRVAMLMSNVEAADAMRGKLNESVERVATASDAAEQKAADIRKKLHQSAGEALDAPRAELDRMIETATTKIEVLRKSITEDRLEMNSVVEEYHATIAEAQQKAADLRKKLDDSVNDAVNTQCAELDQMIKTRVRTFVEEVGVNVDQVQECVANLTSKVAAADTVCGKLDESVERVGTASDAAEQKVADIRKKLLQSASDATNDQRAELDRMIGTAATQVEVLRKSISERRREMNRAEQEAADLRAKLHKSASDAINAQRAELDGMVETATTQIETLRKSISEGRLEMNSVVEEYHVNTAQSVESVDRRARSLMQTFDTLDNRRQQIETSIAPVASTLASAKSQADELTASTQQLRSSIDELSCRAATSVSDLSNALGRADKLLPEVRQTCAHLDATRLSLAATLEDAGRSCERVSAVQMEAAGVRELGERLALTCADGEKIAGRIQESTASGLEIRQRIDQSTAEAKTQTDRVEALSVSAGHLLDGITQATTTGQDVLVRMRDSRADLDQTVEAADRSTAELAAERASSENTGKQLEELTSSARQMLDAAQSVVAHADEKIGQMASHQAAATSITRALSEATIKGHSVVENVNESTVTITKVINEGREHLDRLLEDVCALSTRTENNTKALKAHGDKASALIQTLEIASPEVNRLMAGLTERLDQAKQSMATIAERCDHASELAERLETITSLLAAAKQRETSIKQADEKARATQDLLVGAGETAAKQGADLTQLNALAHGLIETYAQMKCETDTAIERLEAQMSATQRSVEVGEPMLSEFIAQSRAIERNLGELHSKACDVECVVNEAVARPTKILASAQAQADQLERVCGAVKKVFSRLSQATLDAKAQSGVCAEVTKQAAAQVGAITSQSVGAARTLREWTEEAVRAQARLERTLIACPTIHETHPGNAIRRVPQLNAKSSGRLVNPSGTTGELAVLPTPGAATTPLKQETVKPTSRAEEISHLIEDVKRAPV